MTDHGSASFWILIRQKADLSAARSITKWGARGAFVVRQLKSVANSSQRALRTYLDANNVSYQPFWIINGIRVVGAKAPMLSEVAGWSEVQRIVPTWRVPLERAIRPERARPGRGVGASRTSAPTGCGSGSASEARAPWWRTSTRASSSITRRW
jgi:hypothetical protein